MLSSLARFETENFADPSVGMGLLDSSSLKNIMNAAPGLLGGMGSPASVRVNIASSFVSIYQRGEL